MRRPVLAAVFVGVMAAGGGGEGVVAQPTGDAGASGAAGGFEIRTPTGLETGAFGEPRPIAFPPRDAVYRPPTRWQRVKAFFLNNPLLILLAVSFLVALAKGNEDAWALLAVGAAIAAAVWGGARVVEWAKTTGWIGSRSFAIAGTALLVCVAVGLHRLHVGSPRLFAFTEIAFGSVGLFYGLRNVGSPGGWAAVAVGVYGIVEGIDRWKQARPPDVKETKRSPDARPSPEPDAKPEPGATQTPQVL